MTPFAEGTPPAGRLPVGARNGRIGKNDGRRLCRRSWAIRTITDAANLRRSTSGTWAARIALILINLTSIAPLWLRFIRMTHTYWRSLIGPLVTLVTVIGLHAVNHYLV